MPRLHNATLPHNATAIHKLFEQWGWAILASSTNHIRYRKDDVTVSVRKGAGTSSITHEPVKFAAKKDGVSIEEWLKGPQKEGKQETGDHVFEHELDYFIQTPEWKIQRFTDVEKEFLRIKAKLRQRDMLRMTKEARSKYQMANPTEAPPVEPLPVKTNEAGYITLDDALALRGLKQNKLTYSSCALLAALTLGTIEDSEGLATRKLHGLMLNPPAQLTSVSSLLKAFDDVDLIWREIKGKRCFKIALSIPISLTDEEKVKYLKAPDDWSTTEGGIVEKTAPVAEPDTTITIEEVAKEPTEEELNQALREDGIVEAMEDEVYGPKLTEAGLSRIDELIDSVPETPQSRRTRERLALGEEQLQIEGIRERVASAREKTAGLEERMSALEAGILEEEIEQASNKAKKYQREYLQKRGDALAIVMADDSLMEKLSPLSKLPVVIQELIKYLPKDGEQWSAVEQRLWLDCMESAIPVVYKTSM